MIKLETVSGSSFNKLAIGDTFMVPTIDYVIYTKIAACGKDAMFNCIYFDTTHNCQNIACIEEFSYVNLVKIKSVEIIVNPIYKV